MLVLGISCYFHDAAACLIRDGVVVAAAEEERFTRIKHDVRFPTQSIKFCLEQAKITSQDLDYVAFYEKPGLKLDRILSSLANGFPKTKDLFAHVLKNWGKEKLWTRQTICARLGIDKNKVLFSEHHLSHAASSFYCSPFLESACLTLDGVGEWLTATLGYASATNFSRYSNIYFPHSLGLLYTAFTEFLGFEVNDGEYKVMGMAPYGQAIYKDKIYQLFKSLSSSSFELDMSYFDYEFSINSSLTPKFIQIFGEPRKKEEAFLTKELAKELGQDFEQASTELLKRSQYFADLAASLQEVVEEIILGLVADLNKNTKSENLTISGGVAYNSVANGRILRESNFKNMYIQPAAGDSGAAIGAALAVYYADSGKRQQTQILDHAYLGKSYSDPEIKETLDASGQKYEVVKNEDDLIKKVSEYLVQGKVIGWHQGRFEFGPRALGCRSILADPRSIKMKEVVNSKVKFRELFRPFAPACLEEYVTTYFDLTKEQAQQLPLRFMLCVVPVRPEYSHKLEAITHANLSARVQSVSKDTNPLFHKLIKSFGDASGVYCLLNTSFNRRGEPIVTTPQDALTTFEWSAIDVLVIGNFIVRRG